MADDPASIPAAPDDAAGDAGGGRWARWRLPLLTTLIALPLIAIGGGARLGCAMGMLELPVCGAVDAPVAQAVAEVEISGGQTTVTVSDGAGAPIATVQEPADLFPGQFLKFVVVAPDGSSVLYVTAASLGMDDAKLWVVPRGGTKTLLKDLGDKFWIARPVWCQSAPGDPGRIAYVMRGPTGGDLTGLELWVMNGDGSDDRQALVGATQNGFGPALFYGDRLTPLRFLAGCAGLRFSDSDGADRRVVNLDTGEIHTTMTLPGQSLPATGVTPVPEAVAPAQSTAGGPPCLVKPFAQTDPRWGSQLMQTEGTTIRSWGCALTSTAMVFNYYGVDTDPGRLNQCAGNQADLLYWDPVRAHCAQSKITATRWNGQASWAELEASLREGRPVIVGLQGGPAGSHFLVVASGSGASPENYHIVDSWDGSTYKTLADYVNPKKGYILKWLVVFEGAPPPCTPIAGPTDPGVIAFTSPMSGGIYNTPQRVEYTVQATQPDATIEASHPAGAMIGGEGPHTVTVTVTQGGQTYRERRHFLIDRTPPQVSAAWRPAGSSSISLQVTATDEISSVMEARYRVDDGPWQTISTSTAERVSLDLKPVEVEGLAPGPHVIRYYAVDSAGNLSAEAELPVTVLVAVSADRLRIEPDQTTTTVALRSTAGAPIAWSIAGGEDLGWLTLSARAGELPADGTPVEVAVSVDRAALANREPPPVALRLLADGAPAAELPLTVAGAAATTSPMPTRAPTSTPISTPTSAPTAIGALPATPSATPFPTMTPTPTATLLPGVTPTATPVATPTIMPSASPTPAPAAAPTMSPTATAMPTLTPTATFSATPTATVPPTPTATPTPSPTATWTPTPLPTATPTPTTAPTSTATPTSVPTPTPTETATPLPTPTATATPTPMEPISPSPQFAGVTLSNVKVNSGGNTAHVAPGSAISVSLDYTIIDPDCPNCIDQIVLGFSAAAPTQCVYNGIPGASGASGSTTASFTAPAASGVYYLAFDRAQHFSCAQALASGWWNGPPGNNRYFAAIQVGSD